MPRKRTAGTGRHNFHRPFGKVEFDAEAGGRETRRLEREISRKRSGDRRAGRT